MAAKKLSINQILCATLEELKDYANTKGNTFTSGATKSIKQGLLIIVWSKSDETQIVQAIMQLLAAEQDALARKLAAENQTRIGGLKRQRESSLPNSRYSSESTLPNNKLEMPSSRRPRGSSLPNTRRPRESSLPNFSCLARVARKVNVGWLRKQKRAKRKRGARSDWTRTIASAWKWYGAQMRTTEAGNLRSKASARSRWSRAMSRLWPSEFL